MIYLFQLGQNCFAEFVQELADYGIEVDPTLELRRGEGMWCRYNMDERQIYLSVPDIAEPGGKLYLLYLRSLLRCENNHEFLRLSEFLIPYFVAHEMGHHLRHRYGQFSDNLWHEEQVANQLAIALSKRRLDTAERATVASLVQRAVKGLSEKLDIVDRGVDSYRDLWHALHMSGVLCTEAFQQMRLVHKMFSVEDQDLVQGSGELSDVLRLHMKQRAAVIDEINTEYADNMARYLYYHLHWLSLELASHEYEYLTAFAHEHLGLALPLLPLIPVPGQPTTGAILACFRAYRQTADRSPVASAYFYKRYRALLLRRLRDENIELRGTTSRLRNLETSMLRSYASSEPDLLSYVAHLVPPSIQGLFPGQIQEHPELSGIEATALPTDSDQRLWAHTMSSTAGLPGDDAAANTLRLLGILHQIEAFGALPAEVCMELAHMFCTVKLKEGETLIWKGDVNHDVYVLIEGELAVFISQDGRGHCVARLKKGDLIGEMAFLTRDTRQATVRATTDVECLVLRDIDLHLLSFKHPEIMMTIGRVLARRLAEMNRTLQTQSVAENRTN